MKLVSLFLLALVSLITLSCSEKETPGGVKYTVLKKGDGIEVATGQFLVMDLSLRDSNDSVWFDTKDTEYPAVLPVPDGSMLKDDGEYGVFKALTKGDCVTFKVPAQTVFTKTRGSAIPNGVKPTSLFTYVANLKDIWNEEQLNMFQKEMGAKNHRKQVTTDSTIIANHLNEKENGQVALSTPSGLRYIILKEGKGEKATSGKIANIHYAGYLLNGKLFDTSLTRVAEANNFAKKVDNVPYTVVVNTGGVIRGWDEMLLLMNKGMKVKAFIPSYLAWGSRAAGPDIPANAIVVFEMELLDFK
jgi:FKBP-type peptidyl-prolyl cis-trans isomerase FkpA